MFIDALINNNGAAPTLERLLRFTEVRQAMLADDVANISTPNYRQKDLSVAAFQQTLRQRLAGGEQGGDIVAEAVADSTHGILNHDGNNRSMEQLMSDGAQNALMHNTVVELLRRQYQTLDMALRDRVG